jgi:hypothetical protein
MIKSIFFFFLFVVVFFFQGFSKEKSIVTIKGFAPAYVGKTVELFTIEDYFSRKESLIASSMVLEDSTFSFSFYNEKTQKVILKSNKNTTYLYIQPSGIYEVFLPEKDSYDPYRPNGNSVELAFYGLDSMDINYKVLGFERWVDDFLGTYFYIKKSNGTEFSIQLDKFKTNVEKAYMNDSSTYFKTFVRFRMASLDEIQQAATRNNFEKHDFYIKKSPVSYDNDVYMDYIVKFYDNLVPRLSFEVNNAVYLGVLKSSPTLVMKALSGEYTLINLRLREMIMVKMLSDYFYKGDFPQTNTLTIMDSVSRFAMFEANKIIASNLKERLTELVPGGKAPGFSLKNKEGVTVNATNYTSKHVYFHFFDPSSLGNLKELQLLVPIQLKYYNDVDFVTVYKKKETYSETELKALESIKWDKFEVSDDDEILKNYQIQTFPSYVLLDRYGYVVSSPALGPLPNGNRENIEKVFFYIQKMNLENKTEEK